MRCVVCGQSDHTSKDCKAPERQLDPKKEKITGSDEQLLKEKVRKGTKELQEKERFPVKMQTKAKERRVKRKARAIMFRIVHRRPILRTPLPPGRPHAAASASNSE